MQAELIESMRGANDGRWPKLPQPDFSLTSRSKKYLEAANGPRPAKPAINLSFFSIFHQASSAIKIVRTIRKQPNPNSRSSEMAKKHHFFIVQTYRLSDFFSFENVKTTI
ncbi:hypothetical protein [Pseudomonas saponiphila]|uniref:hypothetical protein n=1 Tax=Pseudomonas saponiphila TaxID=556534 RepID=UPI00115FECDB|nr:hypothetical protein [Pseudomonas saponiphila]